MSLSSIHCMRGDSIEYKLRRHIDFQATMLERLAETERRLDALTEFHEVLQKRLDEVTGPRYDVLEMDPTRTPVR